MQSSSRATVEVLAELDADASLQAELSPMGQSFFQFSAAAYEMASGGVDIGDVLKLGATVVDSLGIKASDMLLGILGDLGEDVAAALGVATAATGPLGAFVAVLATGLKVSAAYTQAAREKSAEACQRWYRAPGPATRATAYGGLLPCDFLHGSVGEVFRDVGERNCHLEMIGGYKVLVCGGPNRGIAPETREVLKKLRVAIQSARGDPKSDGGLTLWPVYLDLMRAQFDRGAVDWSLANWIYDCEVLPPYLYYASGAAGSSDWQRCKCRSYEKRAWQEFQQVLTDWKLTIEPVYAMDQPKAAELRSRIDAALRRIRGQTKLTAGQAARFAGKGNVRLLGPVKSPAKPAVVAAAAGTVAIGSALLWGDVAWRAVRRLL